MLAHKDLLIEAAYAGARKALEPASIPARFLTPKETSHFLGVVFSLYRQYELQLVNQR